MAVKGGDGFTSLSQSVGAATVPEAHKSNDHDNHHEDKACDGGAHNQGELLLKLLGT